MLFNFCCCLVVKKYWLPNMFVFKSALWFKKHTKKQQHLYELLVCIFVCWEHSMRDALLFSRATFREQENSWMKPTLLLRYTFLIVVSADQLLWCFLFGFMGGGGGGGGLHLGVCGGCMEGDTFCACLLILFHLEYFSSLFCFVLFFSFFSVVVVCPDITVMVDWA